jgi:hypothetical protein
MHVSQHKVLAACCAILANSQTMFIKITNIYNKIIINIAALISDYKFVAGLLNTKSTSYFNNNDKRLQQKITWFAII